MRPPREGNAAPSRASSSPVHNRSMSYPGLSTTARGTGRPRAIHIGFSTLSILDDGHTENTSDLMLQG